MSIFFKTRNAVGPQSAKHGHLLACFQSQTYSALKIFSAIHVRVPKLAKISEKLRPLALTTVMDCAVEVDGSVVNVIIGARVGESHIDNGTLTNHHNERIKVRNARVTDPTLSSCKGRCRQAQGLRRAD